MSNPFDGGGLGSMMSAVQGQLRQIQEQAAQVEVTGRAGGALVEVVANGQQEILSVRIAPSAAADVEMLEDLVAAATNDALRQSKEAVAEKMRDLTKALGLPPGLL